VGELLAGKKTFEVIWEGETEDPRAPCARKGSRISATAVPGTSIGVAPKKKKTGGDNLNEKGDRGMGQILVQRVRKNCHNLKPESNSIYQQPKKGNRQKRK